MKNVILALVVFLLAATIHAAPATGSSGDCAAAAATVASLRSVQITADAYHIDYKKYPKAASIEELQPLVSPVYIRTMPLRDGWGNPILYMTFADGKAYVIASPGADGKFDESTWTREPKSYSDDAVIRSGVAPRVWSVGADCK